MNLKFGVEFFELIKIINSMKKYHEIDITVKKKSGFKFSNDDPLILLSVHIFKYYLENSRKHRKNIFSIRSSGQR